MNFISIKMFLKSVSSSVECAQNQKGKSREISNTMMMMSRDLNQEIKEQRSVRDVY